jgi:glycosyltransferase involved in cell wall biosynthesis
MLDLHDLGMRQTGNESFARCLSAALFELDGVQSYDVALTARVPAALAASLPARRTASVSTWSSRRLALDLPRAMHRFGTPSVLVQYTVPLSKVPAVVVVHDLSFEDPRAAEWLPLSTRLRYRASIRTSVRRARHVVTVSEFSRRDIIERYGVDPERVHVAHNAVDPRLSVALDATPAQPSGQPTVLVVGNVLPRKNHLVLAEGVGLLRARGVDVRLHVLGRVPAAGRAIAESVSRRLGDAVRFSGYASDGDLARAYRSAHVLAYPSLFEGFGIPVLEAMRADVPVVVSDRTALPETVDGAGLVVPAEDAGAWADALERAVGADAAHLVAAGREREQHFRWRTSAATVSRLLHAAV